MNEQRKGRVLACSDLHGRKDLFDKINAILEEDDEVIFCGDAADRGYDGWEIIKAMISDPRWTYVRGNHDDMLIKAAHHYFRTGSYGRDYSLLRSNGGKHTFEDMKHDPDNKEWIQLLNGFPTYEVYHNAMGKTVVCSHAGFTPWKDDSGCLLIPEDEDLIWDRSHFLDEWDSKEMHENVICVHGHTSVIHLLEDLTYIDVEDDFVDDPTILTYCLGHKIAIDLLSAYTGKVVLLDLDTLTPIYIKAEE